MRIVEAPIGAQFSLLAAGEADIAVDIEPYVSFAESERNCRVVYSYAERHGPLLMTGIYTLQDVIDSNEPVVAGVVRSIDAALKLIRSDPDVAVRASGRVMPEVPASVHRKAVRRILEADIWPETYRVDAGCWKNAIAVRERAGDDYADDVMAFLAGKICG
ncbi:MAG: hypothetical protein EOM26_13380 [Alphaproteobacteria bacterium]|nr:hypothetical protein [Alphaproteobacteria bacterium]